MIRIAIIGAGIAGLTLANLLKQQAEIKLFEKARGVGGRMATRRAEPYFFDHGAQYFTARTQPFQQFLQPLLDAGVVQRWNPAYVKFVGDRITERQNWELGEPRYVGVPGMNAIAKHLAADLPIQLNTRVVPLQRGNKWRLYDDQGGLLGDFDWVITTAPAPQTLDLLPQKFQYHAQIKTAAMQPCFCLMLGFKTPLTLAFQAAHLVAADLSWLAVNSHKPGRPSPFTLVVHSSAAYAEAAIGQDHDAVKQHLCAVTSRLIGHDVSTADYQTLHLWRYANNVSRSALAVLLDADAQLAACGDWCQGGRVEGAFMAARHLAEKLKPFL